MFLANPPTVAQCHIQKTQDHLPTANPPTVAKCHIQNATNLFINCQLKKKTQQLSLCQMQTEMSTLHQI